MTKSQERTINEIKAHFEAQNERRGTEFKQFEVNDTEYLVSLVIVTGGINDEGTMAEVFARDRRHLFIGKRGGIKLANPGRYNEKTKSIDFCNKRVHGWKALYALSK
jgi:hypothetical protein